MKRMQTAAIQILAAVILAGCAAAPPAVERQEIAAPPPVLEERAVPRSFEDRDLFLKGMELLARTEAPDFGEPRALFLSLVERYPQSRWRPAAEALVRRIDEQESRREALQEETVRLRQTLQQTQAERSRLQQENEQLRKDIKRLRDLEIEIEKRERMLR